MKATTEAELQKYKGQLVMPHPASSGTGYLTIAAWLQVMGEAEGWKYMDALHQNIAVYTHSGSAPCVQAATGERLIGIGFDMRFHERIFAIFQRLERVEDYPGSGMGLAMVRRAAERLGGRVWAESAPGEGASFFVEIPG